MRITIYFVLMFVAGCSKTVQNDPAVPPMPSNTSRAPIIEMVTPNVPTRVVDEVERAIDEITVIGSNLSDEDVSNIRKAIDAMRKEIFGDIVLIQHLSEYTVKVTTRTDRRPLSGGGSVVRLEFDGVVWRVKDITNFIS